MCWETLIRLTEQLLRDETRDSNFLTNLILIGLSSVLRLFRFIIRNVLRIRGKTATRIFIQGIEFLRIQLKMKLEERLKINF